MNSIKCKKKSPYLIFWSKFQLISILKQLLFMYNNALNAPQKEEKTLKCLPHKSSKSTIKATLAVYNSYNITPNAKMTANFKNLGKFLPINIFKLSFSNEIFGLLHPQNEKKS